MKNLTNILIIMAGIALAYFIPNFRFRILGIAVIVYGAYRMGKQSQKRY